MGENYEKCLKMAMKIERFWILGEILSKVSVSLVSLGRHNI